MLEYEWVVIAILDGNLKLKIEPSSNCMMYCDETSLFVTLQARDTCKPLNLYLSLPIDCCILFSCV